MTSLLFVDCVHFEISDLMYMSFYQLLVNEGLYDESKSPVNNIKRNNIRLCFV